MEAGFITPIHYEKDFVMLHCCCVESLASCRRWIAKCIGKENEKIITAVDLNQDAKNPRKNTSDSTDSSKRQCE